MGIEKGDPRRPQGAGIQDRREGGAGHRRGRGSEDIFVRDTGARARQGFGQTAVEAAWSRLDAAAPAGKVCAQGRRAEDDLWDWQERIRADSCVGEGAAEVGVALLPRSLRAVQLLMWLRSLWASAGGSDRRECSSRDG